MLQRIENTQEEILDSVFAKIVRDEIEEERKVERIDPDNMRAVQLKSNPNISLLK